MSKHIDADKLVAEIESRMEDCKLPNGKFPTTTNAVRYEELSCIRNLVDSLRPEKPSEWSEEDEKFYHLLHTGLYAMKGRIGGDEYNKALNRLESLRISLHKDEIVELSFKGGTCRVDGEERTFKGGRAKIVILEINQEEESKWS